MSIDGKGFLLSNMVAKAMDCHDDDKLYFSNQQRMLCLHIFLLFYWQLALWIEDIQYQTKSAKLTT